MMIVDWKLIFMLHLEELEWKFIFEYEIFLHAKHLPTDRIALPGRSVLCFKRNQSLSQNELKFVSFICVTGANLTSTNFRMTNATVKHNIVNQTAGENATKKKAPPEDRFVLFTWVIVCMLSWMNGTRNLTELYRSSVWVHPPVPSSHEQMSSVSTVLFPIEHACIRLMNSVNPTRAAV